MADLKLKEHDDEWLRFYGKEMTMCRKEKPPKGYSIISGTINRFGGKVLHSCVALDGKLVHDPHPSKSGLAEVRDYIEITKEE